METMMLKSLMATIAIIETMVLAIVSKATDDALGDTCKAILKHVEGARERLNVLGGAYHQGMVPSATQGKATVFDKASASKLGDLLLQAETMCYSLNRTFTNLMEQKSVRTIGCNMRNGRQRLDIVARASKLGSIIPLTGGRDATREAIDTRIDSLVTKGKGKKTITKKN